MKAADIMTPQVVTVRPETPVADAVKLMLQDQISGLPVVDKHGKLQGIVTEGDFLRRSELGTERKRKRWLEWLMGPGLADEYVHAHGRKIADVMTTDVCTVGADASLDDVVELMERRHIKRIPVIDKDKLIGIISRANLLRALAAIAADARVSTRSVESDTVIRRKILAEMRAQAWAPIGTVSVVVWDGTVHFWGTVSDENQRRALRVLAEDVPGVSEVRDHLDVVQPLPPIYAD